MGISGRQGRTHGPRAVTKGQRKEGVSAQTLIGQWLKAAGKGVLIAPALPGCQANSNRKSLGKEMQVQLLEVTQVVRAGGHG